MSYRKRPDEVAQRSWEGDKRAGSSSRVGKKYTGGSLADELLPEPL